MQPADLTVLIPCNRIEYLKECLISIEEQTRPPKLVIIILNGEAVDLSRDSIVSFKNLLSCELKFYICRNPGIVPALNLGLKKSATTYIARLDSDDLMTRDRIEKQVSFLDMNEEVVAVGGQILDFDTNKKKIPYPENHNDIFNSLFRFSSLPHPGVTFRLSAANAVGPYSQDFDHVEDWDFWIRLTKVGKLANLSIPVIRYRVHPLQVTNTNSAQAMNGQIQLTKKRFLNSILNFGDECGCLKCLNKLNNINLRPRLGRSLKIKILKSVHDLNYCVSCLGGYLYVLGSRTKKTDQFLGFAILMLSAILKPNWFISSLKRKRSKQSILKQL